MPQPLTTAPAMSAAFLVQCADRCNAHRLVGGPAAAGLPVACAIALLANFPTRAPSAGWKRSHAAIVMVTTIVAADLFAAS
jgi:hypothetical protein